MIVGREGREAREAHEVREAREARECRDRSAPVLIAAVIFFSAAVGALLARRADALTKPEFLGFQTIPTPEFPTCEKGERGEKGETGAKGEKGETGKCEFLGIPTRTQHAPNLAWLCPLCSCAKESNGPTGLCDAIHARATKIITNFHAACTLCSESESASSILESTKADIFFFDVGYPFRAVDTCSGKAITSCVLCDNVTGVEPNCGVDNLGKMRDLRVTASRDMACRQNNQQLCSCVHAEELTPVSWSECAAIVHRNKESPGEYNSHAQYNHGGVRYLGYAYNSDSMNVMPLEPAAAGKCAGTYPHKCRPERFSASQLSAANDTLGTLSVAAAIAKFYGSDKDAAGHAAIKAICRARGAGTTCGGLTGPTGLVGLVQTGTARGMLVTFAPITKEANWIEPVTLFSV